MYWDFSENGWLLERTTGLIIDLDSIKNELSGRWDIQTCVQAVKLESKRLGIKLTYHHLDLLKRMLLDWAENGPTSMQEPLEVH
jgi:hypothetical protein